MFSHAPNSTWAALFLQRRDSISNKQPRLHVQEAARCDLWQRKQQRSQEFKKHKESWNRRPLSFAFLLEQIALLRRLQPPLTQTPTVRFGCICLLRHASIVPLLLCSRPAAHSCRGHLAREPPTPLGPLGQSDPSDPRTIGPLTHRRGGHKGHARQLEFAGTRRRKAARAHREPAAPAVAAALAAGDPAACATPPRRSPWYLQPAARHRQHGADVAGDQARACGIGRSVRGRRRRGRRRRGDDAVAAPQRRPARRDRWPACTFRRSILGALRMRHDAECGPRVFGEVSAWHSSEDPQLAAPPPPSAR